MNLRTIPNRQLDLLTASASPASALTYYVGLTGFEAEMMHRTTLPESPADRATRCATSGSVEDEPKRSHAGSVGGWLRRIFDRFEAWSWEREMREHEAYLARSRDLADLETRMRQLDGDAFLSRARALR